jgi:pimeloyl-ACP methyl ester carboxylesterase
MTQVPAHKEAGAGERLLLFLHGIGGGKASFDDQLAAFSSGWRCVSWDMPGYGDSAALPEMTWPALADAAVALLDKVGARRAVVVGHSMGGMIAQELAVRRPDRVAAQVLYATTPFFGSKDGSFQKAFLAQRLAPLDRGLTPAAMAPEVIGAMLRPEAPAAARQRAIACMSAIPAAAYRAALQCLVTFDRNDDLPRIAAPTLVLACDRDQIAPARTMAKMAERIPGARYVCLPGLGHQGHLEDAAAFDGALADFFRAL